MNRLVKTFADDTAFATGAFAQSTVAPSTTSRRPGCSWSRRSPGKEVGP
jgi:hypothetical protein